VAGAFFCAYCLVWAGIDRERYLLPVTTFLVPVCLLEAYRWWCGPDGGWKRKAGAVLLFMNLPLLAGNITAAGFKVQSRTLIGERFYAADNPSWSNPDIQVLADWVRRHLGGDDVICAENPFLLNYLTARSAVLLPEQVQPEGLRRFMKDYGVSYVAINPVFTKRDPQRLLASERALEAAGASEAGVAGTYRVWKLPAAP
jgi:hypothetical protein